MSQAGIIDFIGTHPEIPTLFVANVGEAVPIANTIEILGEGVAAHSIPVETVGSGNTITIEVQYSSANASSSASHAGLASFDATFFTVDANGFVTLNGSGFGQTITGNSGGAIAPVAGNWNLLTANATVTFVGTAGTETLDFGLSNLILGSAPTVSGIANVGLGQLALNALTAGSACVAIGQQALKSFTSGAGGAGNNIAIGQACAANLLTGVRNIILGAVAGNAYIGAESSNILINNIGSASESNTIRIGTQGSSAGQQNRAFFAGIVGTTVSGNFVNVSSSGQLGEVSSASIGQTITGNSGGGIAPVAGNWNLLTAHATVQFVGTTGTQTLDFGLSNLSLGSSLSSLSSGVSNVVYGTNALLNAVSTSSNTVVGNSAMGSYTGSSSQGSNIAIGSGCLGSLLTGTNNICLGSPAGTGYTGSESSNIVIGTNGTAGENNTIRIGKPGSSSGQQNRAFLAGVTGVTVSASAPVAVDTNGQLSSLGFGTSTFVLTSNGAGSSPTWQAPPASGVTAIVGTANQVLANGTSGSSQTGSVTLTTPQDIATTSSVTFGNVTLGNGGALRSTTTSGNTALIQGYNGSAYVSFLTITNAATPTAQATLSDGSNTSPSYSFAAQNTFGIYRSGTSTMKVGDNGTDIFTWGSVAIAVTNRNFNTAASKTQGLLGTLQFSRTATATNYSTVTGDYLVAVTSTAAARTITLATPSSGNSFLVVKDESGAAGTNNITMQAQSAKTIDGLASYAISTNEGASAFYYDGTNWQSIGWTPGQPTNGKVLIGSTGAQPVWSTLNAGAGVSITNAAGSITIADSLNNYTFFAYLSTNTSSQTGDGTKYIVPFDTVTSPGWDANSNFTTGTGALYTTPVQGEYEFEAAIRFQATTGNMAAHTRIVMWIWATDGSNVDYNILEFGNLQGSTASRLTDAPNDDGVTISGASRMRLPAGYKVNVHVSVDGVTKNVYIGGLNGTTKVSFFSGRCVATY